MSEYTQDMWSNECRLLRATRLEREGRTEEARRVRADAQEMLVSLGQTYCVVCMEFIEFRRGAKRSGWFHVRESDHDGVPERTGFPALTGEDPG
ncbi:MAG: hypothetical protein WD276_08460 [Actinomycetota bacterium]